MDLFTLAHTIVSLVGIFSGLIVVFGFLGSKRLDGWTALFLASTAASCVTGFFFPFHGFKPSYVVGVLTLIMLALAFLARYRRHLAGAWRGTYVVSAMIALYFNVFVLIVQVFLKVPAVHAFAPTQTEGPFKAAQLANLVLFAVLGIGAMKRFRPDPD